MKKALIIPDCHIGAENKKHYELMLAVGKDAQPDEVVLLGDFADIYGVNGHGKDPHVNMPLSKELKLVKARLRELEELFPKAKLVYIEGNHETRLARYIAKHAPELFEVVDLWGLLELCDRWEIVPYRPDQLYQILGSKLYARHEPLSGSTHASYATAVKMGCSVVTGHTHRIQEYQVVMANGEEHRAISLGWLGDKSSRIFDYVKGHHQWSSGFGIAYVEPNGNFHHQTVHIVNNKCMFEGYLYEA